MQRCIPRRAALALFVAAGVATAPGGVAQVDTWGYVEHVARREKTDGLVDTSANFTTLRVNASTHLWEPWIARLSGGLGLTFSQTRQEELSQDGTEATGDARLQLFPRSEFPFEAFVERRDSRIEGEIAGPDFTTTSYGFNQSYNPALGTRLTLQARHTERTEERELPTLARIDSSDDFVTLNVSRAFDAHDLDYRTDYNRATREDPQREHIRRLNMLRHRYGQSPSFTLDNMLTHSDDETRDGPLQNRATQRQLNSTAFWRPRSERPLLVTGSALISGFETRSSGGDSELDFALANGGLSYQWTPALALQANATLSQRDTGAEQASATLTKGTVTYAPAPYSPGGYQYRWTLSGDVANRTGEGTPGGSLQEYAVALGHALSRSRPLGAGVFGASVTQQLARLEDSAERSERTLTHTGTLDWTARDESAATFARFTGSDTRRYAAEDTAFQLLNLQVSRTRQIDRLSSWAGNVTVQRATTESSVGQEGETTTTSAELSYRHVQAFGVPRLVFTSELRGVSDDVGATLQADAMNTERHDRSWTNRLDYTIGRLELSARVVWSRFDDRDHRLIYFLARRHFGGLR